MREDLRDLGAWGVLLVVALALVHAVVWYPAEILDAAAGFVYGFGPAMPLIMACWIANALVAYAIGRNAGAPADLPARRRGPLRADGARRSPKAASPSCSRCA